MKLNYRNALFLLTVALPVAVVDQISKVWALGLDGKPAVTVFQSWFHLTYAENRGALFGLGNSFSELNRKLVFLGFSSLVTFAIVYMLLQRSNTKMLNIVYALVIGGAVGNLYDRFFRGFVVDFIDWHIGDIYHWPTFNIADAAIVVAVALLAYDAIFLAPKREREEKGEASK